MTGLTLLEGYKPQVRIGIATGLVVVGDIVMTGTAPEQDVAGETPSLAARLQAEAEPNGIVIAQGTRKLVGGLFECQDLGTLALKGFCHAGSGMARAAARRRPEPLPCIPSGRSHADHRPGE